MSSAVDPAVSNLMNAQHNALRSKISTAMVGKQLDAARTMGDSVNALLEGSARLSKELGKGAGFDAQG